MSFICDISSLKSALNNIKKIIPSKSSIPILEGVLFSMKEENLILSASNINSYIEINLTAVKKDISEFVLDKQIFSIINSLSEGSVEFIFDKDKKIVNINNGASKFKISYMNADEFPKKQFEKNEGELKLNRKEFVEAVNQTIFAVSTDEGRGIIVGENIEVKNKEVIFAAIDGYRIAIKKLKIEEENEFKITIHAKDLLEIVRILESEEDEIISLIKKEKEIEIYTKNIKTKTKLLEGEYIKYEDIIPKEKKRIIEIEKKEFQEAIKKVSAIVTDKNTSFVKINFSANTELLVENEGEKAESTIDVKKEGDDIEVGFNIKYLEEIISAIKDEKFKLILLEPTSPCIFSPLEGEEYKYVLLPIKL